MKKVVLLSIPFLLLSVLTAFGQDGATLDSRIWNQSYWQRMAEQGLVEVNPDVTAPPPTYLGPSQTPPLVLGGDGPDVPTADDPNVTQSENSVFVNPLDNNKVINSNNSTNWPVTTLYGTSNYRSTDGGAAWFGTVDLTGAGSNSGDPAAAIGLSGRYYVGYINNGFGQGVAYSTNEGTSWTNVTITGSGTDDKNHLWVDNSPTSPHEGNLYSSWTSFGTTSDIVISRSTNDGTSWSSPVDISLAVAGGSHDQGVSIQTGPNGEVYAVWAVYDCWPCDETAIGMAKSTDGGATYAPATRIITGIRGIRQEYPVTFAHRVNSFPVMAVDISSGPRSGWIYVVWTNHGVPGINTGNDRDVYMIRSTNGGTSWSTPIRVNQDPIGLGKLHYEPWVTVDPVTGALSVVFYDNRNTTGAQVEAWVATSIDGGTTWEDFRVSDVAFTPAPIPGLAGGYMGDYLGIASRGGMVYPVWTDNRTGPALSYTSPFQLATNVGWVDGTVTSGGSPLADVTIDFLEGGIQIPGSSDGSGYYLAGAEVDTNTGSQNYTIRATKFGYLEYNAPVTLILDDTISHNISMATAPGGTLMVHAYDNNNAGVGAGVSILLGGEEVVSGATDPGTGDFSTPLPEGTYDVVLDPPSPFANETYTGVVITGNQTTNVDALLQYVLDPDPTEIHDSLVVGQISAKTLTLTNTTDVPVPFRISDDAAALGARIQKMAAQPRAVPILREQAPKGSSDLRVGPPQTEGAGGPDGFGYRWIDSDEPGGPTFSWVDISGVGMPLFMGDDENQGPFNLGFDIDFYGNTYNSVRVVSNGWITFTSTVAFYDNTAIPAAGDPNDAIYPFWDDLYPPGGGTVHYYADGANNQFIVQWTDMPYYPGTAERVTFQVILRPNNEILYQYLDMQGTVTSSTIGIENADGTDGLQVVFNSSYIHNNLATRFYLPNATWISESPDAGTIPANSTQDITVTFDANGLDVGTTYFANITVGATHPDVTTDIIVPASLTTELATTAVLLLDRVLVEFPVTPVFDTAVDSVLARNGGATVLDMTSIASNNPDFVVSPSSAMLDPLDSTYIRIEYTPPGEGLDTGRVIIMSNSQGSPRIDIILNGEAIGVPEFLVNIDSLQVDIEGGAMDSIQFYMRNEGTASGDFVARAITQDPVSGATVEIPMHVSPAARRSAAAYAKGSAPPSAGPAPKGTGKVWSEKQKSLHELLRGTGTTGYSISANLSTFFEELSSFDVTTPGNFRLIASTGDPKYFSGDFGPDGNLYALDYFSNQLVMVDTSNGAVTTVGSSIPFGAETWSGLTYDASTGTWYGASTDIARSTLYEIDGSTGASTMIGQLTGSAGCIDISADNTGQLYGYDILIDEFYSVDKATGVTTSIGPIGFDANFAQGMDFDPATNICYMGAYNNSNGQGELRIVDISTGNTTLVGAFPGQEVTVLGIAGAYGGTWLSVAPTEGTVAIGDSVLMTARFDATIPDIFENPGNYYGDVVVTASNSALEDTLSIPVRMYVVPPAGARLIATPNSLDFGSLQINLSDTMEIVVRNIGLTTLQVFDMETNNEPTFEVLDPHAFTLATNETHTVHVTFNAPFPAGTYDAVMRFMSNDPMDPLIPLTGETFGAPLFVDRIDSLQIDVEGGVRDSIQFYVVNDGTEVGDFSARAVIFPRESGAGSSQPIGIPMEIVSTKRVGKSVPRGTPAPIQAPVQRAGIADYPRGSAAPSAGAAPRSSNAIGRKTTPIRNLLGGGTIAYSISANLSTFFEEWSSWDVTNPGTFRLIANTGDPKYFAGDFAPDGSFYVLDYFTNQLVQIDSSTGAGTTIGSSLPLGFETWSGLTYDLTSATLYAASTDIARSTLYTVDQESGATTVIGELTGMPGCIDISADNAGQLWGYDIINDTWHSIDKATGVATLIGSIGFDANFAQGMDFDPATNICYMGAYNNGVGQGELRTVDVTTGATTLIGAFPFQEVTAMGIPGAGGAQWLSVNPTSGSIAVGDSLLITARFDATDPEIYENPGSYFGEIIVDPSNPLSDPLNIPARMYVVPPVGARLTVDPSSLDFGEVETGSEDTLSVRVRNIGQTTLNVTNITIDDASFRVLAPTSFTVATFDTHRVYVVFTAPASAGAYDGTMSFTSNDPLAPTVPLAGSAVEVSHIGINVESFSFNLTGTDTVRASMTIMNTGTGTLDFQINEGLSGFTDEFIEAQIARSTQQQPMPEGTEKGREIDGPGQPALEGTGGPDAFGYIWIDSDEPGGPSFEWDDITGVGTELAGMSDDENRGPFSLGFNFSFYGNTYSSVRITSNGWISFTSTTTEYSNTAIPASATPNNVVYGFWDDLFPPDGGTIHYYADAANSRFVVQWTDINHISDIGTYTFQIILKSNGEILVQYLDMVGDVMSSTIGIEDSPGAIALQVVYNSAYVHNNLATLYTRDLVPWMSAEPTTGSIAAGDSMEVEVRVHPEGLASGHYEGSFIVSGNTPDVVVVPVTLDLLVDVANENLIPTAYGLSQNYPNPFNPETRIKYSLPEQATVSLKVYNLLGQEVLSLASEVQDAGFYEVTWNGHNNKGATVGTGVYFYRLEATGTSGKKFTELKKMIFLK